MKKLIVLICITLLLISGCSTSEKNEEIKVGAILHLTGNSDGYVAQAMKEGIDLAVYEQNEKGGINGQKIRVIYEDDQKDLLKASNAAKKLLAIDDVSAAITSIHQEIMAVGPMFEAEKTPIVVLWDTNAEIDNLGDYVFSTGLWTETAGTRIAEFAHKTLNAKKFSIIGVNNEWSRAVSKYFKQEVLNLGGEIISEEYVSEDEKDYKTTIAKMKEKNPDAVFVPFTTNLDIVFKQITESGFDKPVLSSDAVTQEIVDRAKGSAEGIYYTNIHVPLDTPSAKSLDKKYQDLYGKKSDQLLFVGLGYDGMLTLIESMKNSGSSKEEIKNGMYGVEDLPGSFGKISISSAGSYARAESIYHVDNNVAVLIEQ